MPATATKSVDALGTGRRKTSVARVRIRAGSGKLTINERELAAFFTIDQDRNTVVAPLEHCGVRGNVDVEILVHGGGNTGQAGACMQGIARALMRFDSDLSDKLREKSFLTRDARMKERKKPGLRGRSPWHAVLEAVNVPLGGYAIRGSARKFADFGRIIALRPVSAL